MRENSDGKNVKCTEKNNENARLSNNYIYLVRILKVCSSNPSKN